MIYSHKLKGIGLCFKLLRSALCSNMANFGVFKLYNDKSLENAFEVRSLRFSDSGEPNCVRSPNQATEGLPFDYKK